ncbi:hypothetical protein AQUCO_02900096v1 [Aquilegia coerulea]|uniref:Uncharacterized protein n=1 Tax=Aquilegia coerulea TaxID=218851 RepID=A0A2G5D3B8_AQUCA|nr:hypothetical protein AQUCO_02900096v1 [Aquilegia coerulea]
MGWSTFKKVARDKCFITYLMSGNDQLFYDLLRFVSHNFSCMDCSFQISEIKVDMYHLVNLTQYEFHFFPF